MAKLFEEFANQIEKEAEKAFDRLFTEIMPLEIPGNLRNIDLAIQIRESMTSITKHAFITGYIAGVFSTVKKRIEDDKNKTL